MRRITDALAMGTRDYVIGLLFAALATPVIAKAPDCSGLEHYPGREAYEYLKNDGALSPENVDFKRSQSRMIASQRIGKKLWRQVFRVTFPLKSGDKIEAIVMNGASAGECSLGPTQIFLVSKELLSSQ
jgi:hypothetical protein